MGKCIAAAVSLTISALDYRTFAWAVLCYIIAHEQTQLNRVVRDRKAQTVFQNMVHVSPT